MRVALLSDAHLNGPADPNQQRLISFLSTLSVDRLCILGDLFQHWWHFGEEPFPQYLPVIEALRPFSLSFVPGNHDWRAGLWLEKHLGAEVGAVLRYEWDGLRVHLAHGDEADDSWGYAGISALLHSRAFTMLVDQMGPERAWRFLGKIAGKPHPDRRPDARLLDRQQRAAEHHLTQADLVVFGHTHQPGLYRLPGGTYVNLGDQISWRSWLLVEGGVPTLQTIPA